MNKIFIIVILCLLPFTNVLTFFDLSIAQSTEFPKCDVNNSIFLNVDEILSKDSRHRYSRAIDTLEAMYCLAKNTNNEELEAISLYKIGFEFKVKSVDVQSLRQMMGYLEKSIEISTKNNYYEHILAAKEILCTTFTSNKIYNQALIYANEFLDAAKVLNDSTKIAEGYMLLGRIHRDQENYSLSDSILNLSLNFQTHSPESNRVTAFTYLHLSHLHRLQKDYEGSIELGNKGFHYSNKAQNQTSFLKATIAMEVILSNIELGKYDNDHLFELIYQHGQKTKSTWMEGNYHLIKGILFEKIDKKQNAIQEYKLSVDNFLNTGAKTHVLNTTKRLMPLLMSENSERAEIKEIYDLSQKISEDINEYNGLDNLFKATYYKLQSEVAKSKYFESTSKNYFNLLIFSFFFILLLGILGIVMYRQYQQRKSYNNVLNKLNLELTESNKEIKDKKEELEAELKLKLITLSSIKNQIKNVEKNLKENSEIETTKKRKILNMLKFENNTDTIESINLKFLDLNKSFVSELSNRYPNLTNNDLKLCLYLKMNMSSKEIAQIQYKTVESVKVNRSRLRKKLNISDSSQNLSIFLNSIQ